MLAVEVELEAALALSWQSEHREPFALERIDHREVPRQRVLSKALARSGHRVQELAERLGKSTTLVRAWSSSIAAHRARRL
jgi:hypothetical protein